MKQRTILFVEKKKALGWWSNDGACALHAYIRNTNPTLSLPKLSVTHNCVYIGYDTVNHYLSAYVFMI